MIVKCRVLVNMDGKIELRNYDFRQLNLDNLYKNVVVAIDGSTTCTGVSIIEANTGGLICSMALIREEKGKTKETKVQFKVKLKRVLTELFKNNKSINKVFYEEPFIEFVNSAEALLMLRTSVEEIIAENEPELDYIKYMEVNNKKWKKLLLHPEKCPVGTELEKQAVKNKILKEMPYMSECTQDELDAYGIGFVATTRISSEDELKSKKKVHAFGYNIDFIGADDEDEFLTLLTDKLDSGELKIPNKVLEQGIRIKEIGGRGKFDDYIFNIMDEDDVMLGLKFKSKHHGNIILKYRIGHLSVEYDYIYAVVWRKSRKS